MDHSRYSVAIRSVGSNPFLEEALIAIHHQSISPEEILIVIPENVEPWPVNDSKVQFILAERGMVTQRAQCITSAKCEIIILLDDDIVLENDAAEKLLHALTSNKADCVVPYWPEGWPKGLWKKIYYAFWGIAVPRISGGIDYTPGGGYFYPLKRPDVGGWLTSGGAGALMAINRIFAIQQKLTGDRSLQKLSSYALRDDGALICSFVKSGGKCMMVPDIRFIHRGGTTRLSAKRSYMAFQAQAYNQVLFWRKYIKPKYDSSSAILLMARICIFWYLCGITSLAVIDALRTWKIDPINGLISGFRALRKRSTDI